MIAILTRQSSNSKQTLGTLELFCTCGNKVFECKTLELDWENNARQKSCIPTGNYNVTPRNSKAYGDHFLVNDVPQRDAILIHHGNFHRDILGCILVGEAHRDIDGDGYKDVTSSKKTLQKLIKQAPKGFKLQIK